MEEQLFFNANAKFYSIFDRSCPRRKLDHMINNAIDNSLHPNSNLI